MNQVADTASARDFDFLHGQWHVMHRKLVRRLVGCSDWLTFSGSLCVEPVLERRGNLDINWLDDPTGAYQAHSLRLFEPQTGEWSIWWIDWRSPAQVDPPVMGGFHAGLGQFYSNDRFEGRPIKVRTTYRLLNPDCAEWTQAFAEEGIESWEINWVMEFSRTA